MSDFIPVNTPLLNGNEKKYLNECIDTGWVSSDGPFVKKFETEFAKKVGRKFGIAVSSGSTALDAALLSLNLPKGSEVIIPTFTIISCAAAIIRAGLKPVLVDSDSVTWNMALHPSIHSPTLESFGEHSGRAGRIKHEILKKLESGSIKAIMVVHIYGLPVDMDPILELSKKYNLKIIEDAAEMHGQTYKNKPCGSFGDVSIFSFYPNKHITTGEGGMIVTDDVEIATKCRSLRNLCFKKEPRFVHDELGFNFRMTNLQAAVGLAQLEKLDEHVKRKREIGNFYNQEFKNLEMLQLPLQKTSYAENIYWVYGLVLKDDVDFDAKVAMQKLAEKGEAVVNTTTVGTRPFFWCMHEQPVLQKMGLFKNKSYPVAEKLARRGFYIPSGLGITDEQLEMVAKKVKEVFR